MLRKINTTWQFENEALLENFLQRNFEQLLGLRVLGQQYAINGQICDLITLTPTGQLAILELKNQEDRYIVQQLTRYFNALVEEKPFQTIADYSQPIRLLAIAPSFSRDTFTDCKYSQLTIELLTFRILASDTAYVLELKQLDTQESQTAVIPYQLTQNQRELPPPPKALLSLLTKDSLPARDGVLSLRQQILSFDTRTKEISSGSSILYGNGKSNPCAELRYDSQRRQIALFLWLPHGIYGSQRNFVARLRIWTDWTTVSDLAHIPKGLGRTITVQEWLDGDLQPVSKVIPKNRWIRERYREDEVWRTKFINSYRDGAGLANSKSGLAMTLKGYRKVIKQPELSNQLSAIAQLTLDTWLSRL